MLLHARTLAIVPSSVQFLADFLTKALQLRVYVRQFRSGSAEPPCADATLVRPLPTIGRFFVSIRGNAGVSSGFWGSLTQFLAAFSRTCLALASQRPCR